MALLNLKWPSASNRANRVSSGPYRGVTEADIPRRRSLSNTDCQGRRQEKPRDMTASRWKTAKNMSVSGSKPKFQPKPPPPRGGRRPDHNISFQLQQGTKSMDTSPEPAVGAQSQKTQLVPAQKQPLHVSSRAETSSNTVKAMTGGGLRLPSADDCSAAAHEALKRSDSAPSSSAMTIPNPLGATCLSSNRPTNGRSSLFGGCSTSEPEDELANTTRSCWDETRDDAATLAADAAALPPRYGLASTTGSKTARSTVSEGQRREPLPQQLGPSKSSSTRSGGSKGPGSGSVPPLLLPDQELLSRGGKMRKVRLVPLRRGKSDVVGGGVRARSDSNSSSSTRVPTSAGSESPLSRRRRSSPGLRTPDTSRPSTTSSTSTACKRASSERLSPNSDSAADLGTDQGHVKARLRVMEWKRRRAEEIKAQQEEQASIEQLQRAEVETEAARKLAAARVEEAERRIVAERESTADAVRAAESAEKWAKASRQRERRRAEVYAINAVMRTAFEREFEAYSLEQTTRTGRAASPAFREKPLTETDSKPSQ